MTVPNQFEIFVENLSKKGWASTAPRETLSTSPHQPLHSLMSMLPAALHFRGMYFSTGRNTSSRCTQSLLNLSPNQHTGAKHDNGLLLTNCCAYPHNGGEKILCLFGDWLAMRNEKCNPDTTTKTRRVKRKRWPGKFVKSLSLGNFDSSPGKDYFQWSCHCHGEGQCNEQPFRIPPICFLWLQKLPVLWNIQDVFAHKTCHALRVPEASSTSSKRFLNRLPCLHLCAKQLETLRHPLIALIKTLTQVWFRNLFLRSLFLL